VKSRVEREEGRREARAAAKNAGMRPIATNRRAFHEYHIEEKIEAGLALTGTEVKSLRDGNASLQDGYVAVEGGEAFLWNVHVPPYTAGSYNNVDAKRKRKLLLHKREILRLSSKIQRSGATCVPLTMYFKGPRVKVEIALVTGKKLHDKRETIRRREADREARAEMKSARRR
jgi:SsrA-binding protein